MYLYTINKRTMLMICRFTGLRRGVESESHLTEVFCYTTNTTRQYGKFSNY